MKTIDHDPHEPPRRVGGWIWWPAWAIVVLLWIGQSYFDGIEIHNLALGGLTGIILAAWAGDMTIRAGRAKDL